MYQRIHVVLSLLAVFTAISSGASVQCNFGLKLYSVESGNAVCAPFGHYGCTESCEWNTTCTQTSHFIAFKGRRTYVTGFILTDNNYLLQCCASLGTIVQMNRLQQPLCVWTSWVNTVELMGSLRMDPPLSKNEYVRDITMERVPKSGKVKLRLQICKFLTQRTNCDKDKMASEERHHYSLLLLRLQRTQLLMNSTTGSLSKSAAELVSAVSQNKPASAAFSVVSRVDERREVGGIISGVAGGDASVESGHLQISGLQPFRQTEAPVLPKLNTAFWDSKSGIPKGSLSHSPPPSGLLPPSSFNFDIVPSEAANQPQTEQRIHQNVQKIQIIRRPYGHSRRLSTNATREFVTRYTKIRDEYPSKQQSFLDETPLKNGLHIKRIGPNTHEGQVKVHAVAFSTSAPLIETTPTPVIQPTTTRPFAVSLNPGYWRTVTVAPPPFLPKQIRPDPIQGLFACCQNQAPGCTQLCKKDVTKDEIKRAIVSQQCPPLSMTSVISCFPQYYDTSSVSQCCSYSRTLPGQCMALCQNDFKPTLAHLACIDHIETIVECYRDLMR